MDAISRGTTGSHPYEGLGEEAFWSPAVAQRHMLDIQGLWSPKFSIQTADPVATFGSCFAQNIGRALQTQGFNWFDAEPAPTGLSPDDARRFNYRIFSARTANIYTASLLLQWCNWAFGVSEPPDEIWEQDGRFYDPFRPTIEPNGFVSPEEMILSRKGTIQAFRRAMKRSSVLVFTLGLTESWKHSSGKYEYPLCPGTIAGEFDTTQHVFLNQNYGDIFDSMRRAINKIKKENPDIRILLTVSPVPLTATASGNHVLVATMQSKSILRAVAGALAEALPYVDYFPSYEVFSSPAFRGTFFNPNLRTVNSHGVKHVMDIFFAGQATKRGGADKPSTRADAAKPASVEQKATRRARGGKSDAPTSAGEDEVVCEEALLEAFGAPSAAAATVI